MSWWILHATYRISTTSYPCSRQRMLTVASHSHRRRAPDTYLEDLTEPPLAQEREQQVAVVQDLELCVLRAVFVSDPFELAHMLQRGADRIVGTTLQRLRQGITHTVFLSRSSLPICSARSFSSCGRWSSYTTSVRHGLVTSHIRPTHLLHLNHAQLENLFVLHILSQCLLMPRVLYSHNPFLSRSIRSSEIVSHIYRIIARVKRLLECIQEALT